MSTLKVISKVSQLYLQEGLFFSIKLTLKSEAKYVLILQKDLDLCLKFAENWQNTKANT